MTVSVVLSAYNGEMYLRDQLDSIVAQTKLPDELLLINDASPDNGITESIIDEYTERYSFVVKKNNPCNLGWAKSFMEGAKETRSDIIMFSDQDDIWDARKIEKTIACFQNKDVYGVICDCINVDEELKPIQKHQNTGNLDGSKFKFDKRFIYPKGVGAAMAVRRSVIDKFYDFWNPAFGHDRYIQVILIMFYKLYYLDMPLIKHRLHGNNATGHKNFDADDRVFALQQNIHFLREISQNPMFDELEMEKRELIEKYIRFASKRAEMLMKKSIAKWAIMPAYDLDFYPTKKTWIGDLKSIIR